MKKVVKEVVRFLFWALIGFVVGYVLIYALCGCVANIPPHASRPKLAVKLAAKPAPAPKKPLAVETDVFLRATVEFGKEPNDCHRLGESYLEGLDRAAAGLEAMLLRNISRMGVTPAPEFGAKIIYISSFCEEPWANGVPMR